MRINSRQVQNFERNRVHYYHWACKNHAFAHISMFAPSTRQNRSLGYFACTSGASSSWRNQNLKGTLRIASPNSLSCFSPFFLAPHRSGSNGSSSPTQHRNTSTGKGGGNIRQHQHIPWHTSLLATRQSHLPHL